MVKATTLAIGWREWVALPELGLPAVKAKVDTGARTSALHAFYVERFRRRSDDYVRFGVHPLQRRTDLVVHCTAPLRDVRQVTDSGGHRERRHLIRTLVRLANLQWTIDLTLTDRDTMIFRMLLGRTAMEDRLMIDPSASFLHGRAPVRRLYGLAARRRPTR